MSLIQITRIATLSALAAALALAAAEPARSESVQAPGDVYETRAPSSRGTGKVYMGREIANVMSHRRMYRLDRSDREQDERTDLLVAALPLEDDYVVADIGAGTGYFSFRVAELIPDGEVLAVDIQQEMLDEIERRKRMRGVDNVRTFLGRVDDPGLGESSVDLAFIVDAYHEFSHPREMMAAIYEALRPGGYLIVVEARAEDGRGGNLHEITEAQARKEIGALAFEWVRTESFLPQQHFLVFRRPAAPD